MPPSPQHPRRAVGVPFALARTVTRPSRHRRPLPTPTCHGPLGSSSSPVPPHRSCRGCFSSRSTGLRVGLPAEGVAVGDDCPCERRHGCGPRCSAANPQSSRRRPAPSPWRCLYEAQTGGRPMKSRAHRLGCRRGHTNVAEVSQLLLLGLWGPSSRAAQNPP